MPRSPGREQLATEEARRSFFPLMKRVSDGETVLITRRAHGAASAASAELTPIAMLTTPQREKLPTWKAYALAEARSKLGDLVAAAAGGVPQVLCRRTSPVAVLLPPNAAPTTSPAAPRRLAALGDVLAEPLHRPGLSWGLPSLDTATGGLTPGLTVVAAGPGAGGSLLVAGSARHTALHQQLPVLYAASGLTRADVAARITAAEAGADYRRLRAGTLTDRERADVDRTLHALRDAPLHIDDGDDLTADAIKETAPDIDGLALIVIDRLQAAADPTAPLSGPALPAAARTLAALAHRLRVPVLAALDTTDPAVLAALNPDVTLVLTREGDRAAARLAERDMGEQTTIPLYADFARARFLDHDQDVAPAEPVAPPATPVPASGEELPTPTGAPAPRPVVSRKATNSSTSGGEREYDYFLSWISSRSVQAREDADGDEETATKALIKRAVPDVMELFALTRVGGTYEHTSYPELPDFLRKTAQKGADQIWEGRPKWRNEDLRQAVRDGSTDPVEVAALDSNAAYLAAFKTHLPKGALRHDADGGFDRRRAGIHRVTPPTWEHPYLPNPIGARNEPGPLLLDEATLRLLIRAHREGLCEAPHVHESWTSHATEAILEKLRRVLAQSRETAIEAGDTVRLEYVKAMYSKFVSTIGESAANREIRRPEWMHTIRSQAFTNLWLKGLRAHKAGLILVQMAGTDELHLAGGDWRQVFTEGRGLAQMKQKTTYTLGGTADV